MGGGTSNSIIATLNKSNDYVIKTIGHEDSGLTTNDVDYLYNSTNNDLGAIINTIIQENDQSYYIRIILFYGSYECSSMININNTSSFELIGIGDVEIDAQTSNALLDIYNNQKVTFSNIKINYNKTPSNSVLISIGSQSLFSFINSTIDIYCGSGSSFSLLNMSGNGTCNLNNSSFIFNGDSNSLNFLNNNSVSDINNVNIENCNFSGSSGGGFWFGFTSQYNISIKNSNFNMQATSGPGTIFNTWNSLILINNDFTYDVASDEGDNYHSYLATIPATHNKCIILNNIMRKSTKAGTLLTSESESNLKDSDVYDFNIIATP